MDKPASAILAPACKSPVDAAAMVANCVAYHVDGKRIGDITLDEISDVLERPDTFVWVGLVEPDEALLEKLQEEFGLHDLAIEDAHNAHQRPKIEAYGESLFIVLHTAVPHNGEVEFGETHMFLGDSYIVTVRHGASVPYSPVRQRCERDAHRMSAGPGYPLYAVMDSVVDSYFPIVEDFEDELVSIEEVIFKGDYQSDTTSRIYELKRNIMELRRATTPLLEMTGSILRNSTPLISPELHPYFRDVYDHVIRINEATDSIREMLNTALQANLSLVSVQQSEVVQKLASWAAILAVPTLIASFYGMNFSNMPELTWTYGYPTVIGMCGLVCGFLYWRFKRARWL